MNQNINSFQKYRDFVLNSYCSFPPEDELSVSAMKREAVRIYEQLADTTAKRDELLAEERQRGTPQQEREHLLQQVGFLFTCAKGGIPYIVS